MSSYPISPTTPLTCHRPVRPRAAERVWSGEGEGEAAARRPRGEEEMGSSVGQHGGRGETGDASTTRWGVDRRRDVSVVRWGGDGRGLAADRSAVRRMPAGGMKGDCVSEIALHFVCLRADRRHCAFCRRDSGSESCM